MSVLRLWSSWFGESAEKEKSPRGFVYATGKILSAFRNRGDGKWVHDMMVVGCWNGGVMTRFMVVSGLSLVGETGATNSLGLARCWWTGLMMDS
jgi:hypothetical protein